MITLLQCPLQTLDVRPLSRVAATPAFTRPREERSRNSAQLPEQPDKAARLIVLAMKLTRN
jgi:hypothetical protein